MIVVMASMTKAIDNSKQREQKGNYSSDHKSPDILEDNYADFLPLRDSFVTLHEIFTKVDFS